MGMANNMDGDIELNESSQNPSMKLNKE